MTMRVMLRHPAPAAAPTSHAPADAGAWGFHRRHRPRRQVAGIDDPGEMLEGILADLVIHHHHQPAIVAGGGRRHMHRLVVAPARLHRQRLRHLRAGRVHAIKAHQHVEHAQHRPAHHWRPWRSGFIVSIQAVL
jgi:hypothetical protein